MLFLESLSFFSFLLDLDLKFEKKGYQNCSVYASKNVDSFYLLYLIFPLSVLFFFFLNRTFFCRNYPVSSGTPPQHLDRYSLAEDLPYFLFLPVSLATFSSFSSAVSAFHTQIENSFPAPKYLHLILSVSDSALFSEFE